ELIECAVRAKRHGTAREWAGQAARFERISDDVRITLDEQQFAMLTPARSAVASAVLAIVAGCGTGAPSENASATGDRGDRVRIGCTVARDQRRPES
nr:hypothetical protein [Chloroflexota bacterium]